MAEQKELLEVHSSDESAKFSEMPKAVATYFIKNIVDNRRENDRFYPREWDAGDYFWNLNEKIKVFPGPGTDKHPNFKFDLNRNEEGLIQIIKTEFNNKELFSWDFTNPKSFAEQRSNTEQYGYPWVHMCDILTAYVLGVMYANGQLQASEVKNIVQTNLDSEIELQKTIAKTYLNQGTSEKQVREYLNAYNKNVDISVESILNERIYRIIEEGSILWAWICFENDILNSETKKEEHAYNKYDKNYLDKLAKYGVKGEHAHFEYIVYKMPNGHKFNIIEPVDYFFQPRKG